jgi:hypothetical protein
MTVRVVGLAVASAHLSSTVLLFTNTTIRDRTTGLAGRSHLLTNASSWIPSDRTPCLTALRDPS